LKSLDVRSVLIQSLPRRLSVGVTVRREDALEFGG
jgi:hypothetical protein